MSNFDFMFTIECPNCGKLFEVSHFAIEVLYSKTELGICPKCGLQITAHLTSRAAATAPQFEVSSDAPPRN
jgi:rRNA maturation endonuclease Nob1